MAAASVSPSSSPRLPSPPPFTEVQIGPISPSVGESFGKETEEFLAASKQSDDASTRRIRPGTKAADMAVGPPLIPLSQLDSPFQLQEHLKALYNHYTRPEGSETVVPISREVAIQLAEPPEGVDRSLWLYELCRFLTMKVNNLIVAFFAEDPPCSSQTCPEMRASEWQYLCAVHDPPKSCCAIDYCCHTLDWATNILTSPKHFPSRLTLGSEAGGSQASLRYLTNIFRRLYRIFAHAWFQHRDVFWQVEGNDGLYIFFKTVCDMYKLIPEDNYTVPAEAEGLDANQSAQEVDARRLTILRKDSEGSLDIEPPSISTGATTRRHKNNPSISSRVTTISEGTEEVEEQPQPPPVAVSEKEEPKEEVAEPETQPMEEVTAEEQNEKSDPQTIEMAEPQVTVEEVQEEGEAKSSATDKVEAQEVEQESEPTVNSSEKPDATTTTESPANAPASTEASSEEKTSSTEDATTEEVESEPGTKQATEQKPEPALEPSKEA
ncbi:Mob1 family protein [Aspergillus clavatus NRRL 1]|uniref:Mob1 family protein n=1 Tax=Aspergillus clavatus (strain ATCC 1007 / CBS 513.65 / DSM 816 / NCTC 3887 / NRRL 1 / QM 1276 / 107) TaxID=344612 RepID=A1C6L2_ASPCL|nr:Mob1 family protein [Aspergillus clavatus NRRL 1]EAW14033.1 Mob1 family protein [Aspergillus clavatus NRRL 1]